MKDTIHGIIYDTDTARELTSYPEAGAETTLYATRGGHFFLHVNVTLVDGKPIPRNKLVEEIVPDVFEVIHATGRGHPRVDHKARIRPISRAKALAWCIRTQIPRTFHKELARFLK